MATTCRRLLGFAAFIVVCTIVAHAGVDAHVEPRMDPKSGACCEAAASWSTLMGSRWR